MLTLADAVCDVGVVERYRAKLVEVPDSGCLWWNGAISRPAGHGRFWLHSNTVVIAHRFGFALANGVDALYQAPLLAHRCDNPLCQRVDENHVIVSTAQGNRTDWMVRSRIGAGGYIGPQSSFERCFQLRGLLHAPVEAAKHLEGLQHRYGFQPALW